MKNIFYIMLYVAVIVFGGTLVFQSSMFKRVSNYYNTEAKDFYENDYESFIDLKLYSMGVNRYLNNYLYSYHVDSNNYSFDFNIYHFEVSDRNKDNYAIMFEIFNFKSNVEIPIIELEINGKYSHEFLVEEVRVNNIEYRLNWFTNGFIEEIDGKSVFKFGDRQIEYIESINLNLKNTKETLLTINDNELFELEVGSVFNVLNETNEFSGNPAKYNVLSSKYENDNEIKLTNRENIEKYNSVLVKDGIIYVVLVLAITFILFVRKPLFNYISNKNKQKQIIEKE